LLVSLILDLVIRFKVPKNLTIDVNTTVYKVASPELVALLLSRGANASLLFHGKTPAQWARENGDETLATLVDRSRMMQTLCTPRAVPRSMVKRGGIETIPIELIKRIMSALFPPLLQFKKPRGDSTPSSPSAS